MKLSNVCIIHREDCSYPTEIPFRPDTAYPEYLFQNYLSTKNAVYDMVRESFLKMGCDKENFGTAQWNPLKEFIKPNQTVVLKPNMVSHKNFSGFSVECIYTHPSIVAAVVDYVIIALEGKGRVLIADAPVQSCDFQELIEKSGYSALLNFYQNHLPDTVSIELKDLRQVKSHIEKNGLLYSEETDEIGTIVSLDEESEFAGESESFYHNCRITDYDPEYLKKYHNKFRHLYAINQAVLEADVIINMPKPKTHRKAGVTISLKNVVGICARKECLPHHTNGSLAEGGDQYNTFSWIKKFQNVLYDKKNYYMQTKKWYAPALLLHLMIRAGNLLMKLLRMDRQMEGSWWGNDTISRTVVDLNKILVYCDKTGKMCSTPQRKQIIVADMIVSGEGNGPLNAEPKNVGCIAVGENPVCFDEVVSKIMGAKMEYMKAIQRARNLKGHYILVEENLAPHLVSNEVKWDNKMLDEITNEQMLFFSCAKGWDIAFYEGKKNKGNGREKA